MIDINTFDDKNIIARTAYGENRSGGIDGMQSVINVIFNRAKKSGWWGNTPREVCLKPYQFSCWLPDDPNWPLITSIDETYPVFAEALALTQQAIDGGLPDITKGATYYFSDHMIQWPHWAQGHTPCATIEHQIFFNSIE